MNEPAKYVSVILAVVALIIAGATWFSRSSDLTLEEAKFADVNQTLSKLLQDAQQSKQALAAAQSTANQGLAAAHASRSCCDATNEKIDRMFKARASQ